MAATVAGRLVTAFPTQDCSTATFYGLLGEELSRIQSALGSEERSGDALVPGDSSAEHQVPDVSSSGASGSAASEVLDRARELGMELQVLHRLDESILRTADVSKLLDAPPQLAPGPSVTGAGSATVRLKQLRAAYVARSQQVNMAHNRYKCLSKHNDLYKTYTRTSTDVLSSDASSPTSTVFPSSGFSSHTSSASGDAPCLIAATAAIGGSSRAGGATSDFLLPADCDVAARPGSGTSVPAPVAMETPFVAGRSEAIARLAAKQASGDMDIDAGDSDTASCTRAFGLPIGVDDMEVPDRSASPPLTSPSPSPPSRGRRGFFSALFGRGRGTNDPPESTAPKSAASRMPQPALAAVPMDEGDQTGEELDTVSVDIVPVRRSLSEPVVARRSALDLGTSRDDQRRGASGLKDATHMAGPSARRSRDKNRRSGEAARVRSEPAPLTRDQRRRRGFQMAEAPAADEFVTSDLSDRSSLFNSESQLYREDEQYEDFTHGRCR